jgi:hypothetical protein
MVAKFCLQDQYKLVDICSGGPGGDTDRINNGKLAGGEGSDCKPGEEFTNGIDVSLWNELIIGVANNFYGWEIIARLTIWKILKLFGVAFHNKFYILKNIIVGQKIH